MNLDIISESVRQNSLKLEKIEERLNEIKEQNRDLHLFLGTLTDKVERMDERLEKLDHSINGNGKIGIKTQVAILEDNQCENRESIKEHSKAIDSFKESAFKTKILWGSSIFIVSGIVSALMKYVL